MFLKMKNKRNRFRNKKGFTLIEAVLVIAITVIVIPMILGTFIIIQDSHANVAFTNDAKDFAYLNQRAIDNVLVNAEAAITSDNTTPGGGFSVIHVVDGHQLMINDSPVFGYNHYTTSSGEPKWDMDIEFSVNGSAPKNVYYTIKIYDRETGDPFYILRSSSYLPNATTSDVIDGGGSSTLLFRPTST